MLNFMQSECIKNNIDFNLQLSGNIYHIINNIITEEELEILLADHIKDAIIAIKHTDNVNKSILVRLGKIEDCYGLYIYDSGIEFEKETLENPDINLSSQFGGGYTVKADKFLSDGQEIELLGEKVRCLLTPGHTKGGMCYYFTGSGILFSGDTLFQQSVGRTDFPGGSMGEIVRSIREKLFVLPDYVRVYTGHGMMTNIKDEKMLNPFAVE